MPKCCKCVRAKWDESLSPSLTSNQHSLTGVIEILTIDADNLADTYSGRIQRFKDCTVTCAKKRLIVRSRKKLFENSNFTN